MKVVCKGTAKLKIIDTDEIIDVNSQDVDWQQDGGDERPMGVELRYVAEYEFSSAKTGKPYMVFWQLWEFPLGLENYKETKINEGVEILKDFEFSLVHEPDFE